MKFVFCVGEQSNHPPPSRPTSNRFEEALPQRSNHSHFCALGRSYSTTPNCGSNRFTTSSVVGACRVRTSQGAEVSANGSLSWTGIGTHGPVPKAPLCLNFLHHHFSIPPLNGPNGSNGPSRSRSITKLPRRVDKGPMKLRFRHSAWDPKQMGNLQLENSFKWRISNC